MKTPKIDVRVPYEPNGLLGHDYNRIMKESKHNWILFLDHDIFLSLNPHWYHICQTAIEQNQHKKPGLFTCKTNVNHKGTGQFDENSPQSDSIEDHRQYAKTVWETHSYSVESIPRASGFFMLVNKSAWFDVGGFIGTGLFREDWIFSKRLVSSGFSIQCMKGLYVYHARHRENRWIETEAVTTDFRNQL